MLKETWKSETLPYLPAPTSIFTEIYGTHKETLNSPGSLDGLVVAPSNGGPDYLYVFGLVAGPFIGGGQPALWVLDTVTGKNIRRVPTQGLLGSIFFINGVTISRNGVIWAKHYYSDELNSLTLGATATALVGEEPSKPVSWSSGGKKILGSKYGSAGYFGSVLIDDSKDILMNTFGHGLTGVGIYELVSGKYKYQFDFPYLVVAMALEDDSRMYVLLGNRQLVLVDYIRGEVLGTAFVPPVKGGDTAVWGGGYWNNPGVLLAWDKTYRRILLMEQQKDNADGTSSVYARGFSLVNDPIRVTTPIPLRVPRYGRQIPVLVQVVDDMNHGVGGYAVDAKVY